MPQKSLKKILREFASPSKKKCGAQSLFITFEGIEGAGKSTLIKALTEKYENLGYEVLCLREPGGTFFGEGLRQVILTSPETLSPLAEAHLFASSRAQLLEEKVLPFLKKKKAIVFLDRYLDSSLAYQGEARGLGFKTVLELHQHYPLCTLPHLTFYLKIDQKLSQERQKKRGNEKDYFEKEKSAFTGRLIAGHEKLIKLFPQRFVPLPGHLSPEELLQLAHQRLQKLIKKRDKKK